jgi:hypothetical protein
MRPCAAGSWCPGASRGLWAGTGAQHGTGRTGSTHTEIHGKTEHVGAMDLGQARWKSQRVGGDGMGRGGTCGSHAWRSWRRGMMGA